MTNTAKRQNIQNLIRPVLNVMTKIEVPGTAFRFPITKDTVNLCETINAGLQSLGRSETLPLQFCPAIREGTELLELDQIPVDQRELFFSLTKDSLSPDIFSSLKKRWTGIVGSVAKAPFDNPRNAEAQKHVPRHDGPRLVIGTSHALRWNWHVRDGVVRCDLPPDAILGQGGAPIWSRRLFEAARRHVAKGGTVGVIVGDFRLGNAIALTPEKDADALFQDGFLAMDARAMTPEIDRRMLARGLAAVRAWQDSFGAQARFIFWSLFGRQVLDRLAGRHIGDGRYQHPVFNYAQTVAQFPDADIVDLSPLLRQPMHEVRRLIIDPSCHPSQIGYLFLNEALLNGRDVASAYRDAVTEVETALFALARRVSGASGGPVLITGRSIWLETLANYMGRTGMVRLAHEGLVLAPLVPVRGQPGIAQMRQEVPPDRCARVVLSAGGRDLSEQLARAFDTPVAFWNDLPHVDWETATSPAITARGETPRHPLARGTEPQAETVITPDLAAHMVEQGPPGMPSWTGLVHLLEQIESGALPASRADPEGGSAPSIKAIEGDALLTDAGIAFLIGGNHSVLKYASGELTPGQRSIDAFRSNIASRHRIARAAGAGYAHVIFPDKQSVLTEAFPHQPVHRLGEIYMERLSASEKPLVLYPVETLRQASAPAVLPLDTHLTDHGSLEVLRLILDVLDIQAHETLDHIAARITRTQRWSGDLGKRFTPPLLQDTLVLDPDWKITELRSPGGFNDGMIDLVFSPEAAVDGTLLLFGDSFFRMMLKHLSAVFSRVIHLRSRFLHPEMATLIRPDYILTGNAERYLANVQPDDEAHAFCLYPQLRNEEIVPMDSDFLAAWHAVTAPKSSVAKSYWHARGIQLAPLS